MTAPELYTNPHVHAAALAVSAGAFAGICVAGRRLERAGRERRFRTYLGVFGIAVWVLTNVWYNTPPRFDLQKNIPLHICDLAALIAPLALLTGRRWLRAVLYFWAFGFTLQAFITPVLLGGPDTVEFWLYWIYHGVIVGFALYDLIVLRFRPQAGDLGRCFLISLLYLAAIFPLDALTGSNYGYVGPSKPDVPTILDALGPWPLRVLWIALLSSAGLVVLWLPWGLAGWYRRPAPTGR
jgi:hypothetical integral membrane protein (TIGR02206 family)